ncbi:coiled-coil domain-containing protein 181-like [Penaeus chinensis]|uniref:coiled-coil domain-containing protein 181-like n=1 Tax=Penaeus chinensis TaxID=139456 RepID=UPI001FB7DA29|nr:coiled-coil domain-containing protein 181-like [Penaeus chinensis]
MRITDTEDDYTVTADQRAALMELETLTWNYPTPGQGRSVGQSQADDDDTDEDDDDDSYYVDIAPYDMTERLKEVNRALLEDPTPAECDRAITIRFRDVIADYQSPREYYPSDSDDGYGDSSDILYDAEEEDDGLTSLTSEAKEVLGGNVNLVDFTSDFVQDNCDYKSVRNGLVSGNDIIKGYGNFDPGDTNSFLISGEKQQNDTRKRDVPKLNLGNNHDDTPSNQTRSKVSSEQITSNVQIPCEKTLLKVDDSGLADLETFMKENESLSEQSSLRADSVNHEVVEMRSGSMSLVEISDRIHVEKGFSSLGDGVNEDFQEVDEVIEGEPESLFERRGSKENIEQNEHLPAKSGSDFACYEYEDDFEDIQDETSCSKDTEDDVKSSSPRVTVQTPVSPRLSKDKVEKPKEVAVRPQAKETADDSPGRKETQESKSLQKQGHKSRKDQGASRKSSATSSSERSKKRAESQSPSDAAKTPAGRTKLKRSSACPPAIKPALLSSDKLGSIRSAEGGKYKNSSRPASRSGHSSLFPSSTFSSHSPSSSASSSSSSPPSSAANSSSSISSSSSSSTARGRTRTPMGGPVRPTQHKNPAAGRAKRGVSSSPVKVPASAHQGLSLTPITPSPAAVPRSAQTPPAVRTAPQHRVRKAASASDLHRAAATEETEDRKRQNEAVFKAWLQQKNKQAAVAKKQSTRAGGGRSSSEVAERRARAEEAFQAWLSRKREQLRLEKKMRGERRRLEDQSRYARTKAECEVAYKEWCRRKRDEVRTSVRVGVGVPRSQSLERPWVQEKTRKLYSAYLSGN